MDCRRVVVKVPVEKSESLRCRIFRLTILLVEIAISGVEDLVTVSINHQSEFDS